MGRRRSGSGSGARRCAGLALLLILTVLTGGAGGVLDTEARLDGVARAPVPSEGTRQHFRSRALAQVDDAPPSAFTTWGPLGAFVPVGETVTFEIHARARDGTLLESFDDPSAFTVAFDGAPGAVLKSSVEPVGGGVFRASFVPSVAGSAGKATAIFSIVVGPVLPSAACWEVASFAMLASFCKTFSFARRACSAAETLSVHARWADRVC